MISWQSGAFESDLPLLAVPAGATDIRGLATWTEQNLPNVRDRLCATGALLFRNFGPATLDEFQSFVRLFSPGDLQRYVGGASSRKHVAGHVYTSTETAAHYTISQHHESAYQRHLPRIIGFLCQIAAEQGGETPVADSRRVYQKLRPTIRDRFTQVGVQYINNLPNGFGLGKSWQNQFETTERTEVEARLRADNHDFEWLPDGSLRTTITCPCAITHPETGDLVWVGQPDHWHPSGLEPRIRDKMRALLPEDRFPMNAKYGDGSPIAEDDLAEIRATIRAERRMFAWQKDDILICDNYLVSHGRQPYTGNRRILVALG